MKIVVGSRQSRLAVIQSEIVIEAIRRSGADADIRLETMKTRGDLILDRSLDQIGGKGLFIEELESALRTGRIDLAVHSLKDMPVDMPADLPLLAASEREDPRDVLVLPADTDKETDMDLSRPIGCSSARRMIQLAQIYPNAEFAPIRGNIQTRLDKVDSGRYAATVLAAAGLKRLGLEHRISRIFDESEMLPAAGQGILAVQGRRGYDAGCLSALMDADAWRAAVCERSFVRALDGGCSSPVAAYARADGDRMILTGLNIDAGGRPFRDTITGDARSDEECEALGSELAARMKTQHDDTKNEDMMI